VNNGSETFGGATVREQVALVNQILQILAILVGGTWALLTWNLDTASSLSTGTAMAMSIESFWEPGSQACYVVTTIRIRNDGERDIVLRDGSMEVLKAPVSRLLPGESYQFLNPELDRLGSTDLKFLTGVYHYKERRLVKSYLLLSPDAKTEIWERATVRDINKKQKNIAMLRVPFCQQGNSTPATATSESFVS
jgi:hypothetical protein